MAADGLNHGIVTPLLLRLGLASSPASGLFPKSVLIGRMRPAGGREVVVNAVPFGPTDEEPVRTFVEKVARSFQPRPQGAQPALIVPASVAPQAFEAFRQILRDTGQNRASLFASFPQAAGAEIAALCAAVRAGWREGYSLGLTDIPAGSTEVLQELGGFTRFSVQATDLAAAAATHDFLRRLKPRGFDFELDFRDGHLTAEALQSWRSSGRGLQSVVPPATSDIEDVAAFLRPLNALPNLVGPISLRAYGRGHRWLNDVDGLVELARSHS
jgi:hypothetical protein